MNLEVVLTQDDPRLGSRGQVVKVSRGFAQNYLFPQDKAKLATPENVKIFEEEKSRRLHRTEEALAHTRELANKISSLSLTLEVKTGEADKLYGSVTGQHIQEELARQGIPIDKKCIHLEEPIRELGAYSVPVKFHSEVSAKLKVWVVKKK